MQGHCLNSQEIREKILQGHIKTNCFKTKEGQLLIDKTLESRIQPASFEPTIGNEIYILDTEMLGVFRARENQQVYTTLLHLPKRQRQKASISQGFELKTGFTYLLPLEERIKLEEGERIESSPKSSIGRVFLRTRMLADSNPTYEEIHYTENAGHVQPWLLVQPLAFNTIVYPGLTLNQLRWFSGDNAMLSSSEIREELKKYPLVQRKEGEKTVPLNPKVTDGIQIHLDLSGANMSGIVGLRARKNPQPIDLSKKEFYDAEDYFEPVISEEEKGVKIKKGEYYLLSSREVLSIPPHLSVQLNRHSTIGLSGPVDFAGFIDPGFQGDLVFELRSDEPSNISLENEGIPISKLELFRSNPPDKVYGKGIGSNYQSQTGIRPAKYFTPFDFKFAAKDYKKLSREVLVQDKKLLLMHRSRELGFEWISPEKFEPLKRCIQEGFFHSRYDCESDEDILQPIPYVLAFNPEGQVFSYVRASNIEDYGDKRLFGKHSIGLGGHIIKPDAPDYIEKCTHREVFGEEVEIEGSHTAPKLQGTLVAYNTSVDRVHFGLIYTLLVNGTVRKKEASIDSGRMIAISNIMHDPLYEKKYETWSRTLIPLLPQLHSKAL
jgi:deoxycytidine triphosphate deaminase/predicted NUDIX family phosphoesterase